MDFSGKKGAGNNTIFRGLNPFSFNHFQKGRIRKSVLALLPFVECHKILLSRKSYFVLPENRTFQKNVPFPENRTYFSFFQKIVLIFHFSRKVYLFSENRTIILYPLSHNGFKRFGFQKFVLIFTFLEIICLNIYNVFIFYLYLYQKQKWSVHLTG